MHDLTPAEMMQNLTRFLLTRVSNDYRSIHPASITLEQSLFNLTAPVDLDDLLSKVLATSYSNSIRCLACRSESTRRESTYVNDLIYPLPQKPAPRGGRATRVTFSQVLKRSVQREETGRAYCSRCRTYQLLQTRKTIHNIPAVLTINAVVTKQEHRLLWSTPGWLPEEIGVIVENGQFFCYEGEDLKLHLQRGIHNITVYSLMGVVVNVENNDQSQKSHLVGMINGECPSRGRSLLGHNGSMDASGVYRLC